MHQITYLIRQYNKILEIFITTIKLTNKCHTCIVMANCEQPLNRNLKLVPFGTRDVTNP